MKHSTLNWLSLSLTCAFTLLVLTSCGGSGSSSTLPGTGTLSTALTDNSTEDYRAIYVSIARIDVHPENGDWYTLDAPGGTYNLLALVNGVREELGLSPLASGHYTQMRLIIGATPQAGTNNILGEAHPFANYLIDQDNIAHKLKVPSSKIKIVHGFDISDNQTTELLLDFDAMKSIVQAGNSGKHLLKPTIKVLRTVDSALVSGRVSDEIDGLTGALVSAQTFSTDPALDAADRVRVERSTLTGNDDPTTPTDEAGGYRLDLAAGDYNLVAYVTGYLPVCKTLRLTVEESAVQDFLLSTTAVGSVSGNVAIAIANASDDQHVQLDFRQAGHCEDATTMINVKTLLVADTGRYELKLPVGDYQVVASTRRETTQVASVTTTQVASVTVTEAGTASHDIFFP